MSLSNANREQAVNHLRAIRGAIEPDVDEPLPSGIRLLTAQGLIDSAIALIAGASPLPNLNPRMEGPPGGVIREVERFDPYRR